ncbi:hypothetical protein SDC9_186989 [bioreactor metagenome]|uniref:Uncharacterized protein n=1 Tax=bioreactor metagenome TaxID=1076179 RepID=A0A645HKC6_9ZZZZ
MSCHIDHIVNSSCYENISVFIFDGAVSRKIVSRKLGEVSAFKSWEIIPNSQQSTWSEWKFDDQKTFVVRVEFISVFVKNHNLISGNWFSC